MNEKVVFLTMCISIAVLLITSAVFAWLYVSSDNAAGKLAEDYKDTTDELAIKVGELATERAERQRIDHRYSILERRYKELGEVLPGFTDGLSDLESGLKGVAGEIRRTGSGLQQDIEELSGIAGEIGRLIAEASEPEQVTEAVTSAEPTTTLQRCWNTRWSGRI